MSPKLLFFFKPVDIFFGSKVLIPVIRMAINGAVFNVTSYMDFHPGGWDELVKALF